MSRMVGFDEDSLHWISIAVRESVANAMKHGNKGDESKRVRSSSSPRRPTGPRELVILVRDQGEGFDPEEVADPLAPENLLKSSGRGIFLIRTFMDDVALRRVPEGGMEVRMVKRLAAGRRDRLVTPPDPRYLATAIEVVTRAGAIQRARFGTGVRVDKKGDHRPGHRGRRRGRAHVPGAARAALPRSRHPRRGARRQRRRAAAPIAGSSTRSTAPPTSRTACRSSARRWRSRSTARRWSAPSSIPTGRSCSPPSAASAPG